jgi:NAD(P)-dependent dehydrogenase (short-subunit alcohol dehydrogenase family)
VTPLDGKTALVAGGTAGIGLAVAEALRLAGADVAIGGRRPDGAEVARAAGCEFVALDVADEGSFKAALASVEERLGKLDVLVLNAGVAQPPGPLAAVDLDTARDVVAVNLLGAFLGLKHGPEHMNDGGSIVVTSSIAAVMGSPFEGLYAATKAGATALVRSGAIDLGSRGIRVNAVQPGPTWTDMNPMPEGLLEVMAPAGRKGRVEDLTGLYVFLASDASSYITGQAITVDGGVTAGISRQLFGLLASQLAEPVE